MGNYKSNENAVELSNQLKAKGYSATVVKVGENYKVFVGSYNSRDKAGEASGQLKKDGFESFVVGE